MLKFDRFPSPPSIFHFLLTSGVTIIAALRTFFVYFRSFQTSNTIFTTNQCEKGSNLHPVYGAGIRTHDLSNMSRHPKPLEQGSHPALRTLFGSMLSFLNNKCWKLFYRNKCESEATLLQHTFLTIPIELEWRRRSKRSHQNIIQPFVRPFYTTWSERLKGLLYYSNPAPFKFLQNELFKIYTTNKWENNPSRIWHWDSNPWPLDHESPSLTHQTRAPAPYLSFYRFLLFKVSKNLLFTGGTFF